MSNSPAKPPTAPAASRAPTRSTNLLALGSAAVLSVYATGFLRTQAAAQRLEDGSDARRRSSAGMATRDEPHVTRDEARSASSGPSTDTMPTTRSVSASPARPSDDSARYTVVVRQGVVQVVATTTPKADSSVGSSKVAVLPTAPTTAVTPSVSATASAPALPVPIQTPEPAPATAAAVAPTAPVADAPKQVGWRDGTYTGWGTSRHGDIEATVVIEGGKITGAIISRCLTRYSCSWVAHLQQQVVARQSPEVDNVSGATQSANAFFYAVSEALAKSK